MQANAAAATILMIFTSHSRIIIVLKLPSRTPAAGAPPGEDRFRQAVTVHC
jgi:flagellar biosynthesis protein FliP